MLFTVLLASDDADASAVIRQACNAVCLAISGRRDDGLDASSIKFLHVCEACIFIVSLVTRKNVALLLVERLQSTASKLRKLAEIAGICALVQRLKAFFCSCFTEAGKMNALLLQTGNRSPG